MEELVKARIQKAVNKVIRSDSNIPYELIEYYKESLVNSVCEMFAALADTYDDQDSMDSSIKKFINTNFKGSNEFHLKGFDTDGYMVASIPIILPVEVVAIVDGMDEYSLPVILRQLSAHLVGTVLALKKDDDISGSIIEKYAQKLAGALKEKGWVA